MCNCASTPCKTCTRRKPMTDRRIGRFTIDLHIVHTKPDLARMILRDVLVLRAEALDYAHCMEYVGEHPEFALLNRYGTVPLYERDIVQRHNEDSAAVAYEIGPWRMRDGK